MCGNTQVMAAESEEWRKGRPAAKGRLLRRVELGAMDVARPLQSEEPYPYNVAYVLRIGWHLNQANPHEVTNIFCDPTTVLSVARDGIN
jgi:hypothetical protein